MCARICIVADLHLRHPYVDTILAWEEPYDRVILLGDTFDQWSDTPHQARDAAIWLKAKLADPRWTMCVGNHDWSYAWWPANEWAYCSGCTEAKAAAVREVMTQEDWLRVRPYAAIPEWGLLFTHAGVDRHLLTMLASSGFYTPGASPTLAALIGWLDSEWPHILTRYQTFSFHPIMECGASRGGLQRVGGITWQDYQEHTPIPGVGQIVGHTIHDTPLFRFHQGADSHAPMWRRADKGPIKEHWLPGGWSLCMDTNSKHYAVLDTTTGILTIRQVLWRRNWDGETGMDAPGFNVAQGRIIAHVQLPRARAEEDVTSPWLNPDGH